MAHDPEPLPEALLFPLASGEKRWFRQALLASLLAHAVLLLFSALGSAPQPVPPAPVLAVKIETAAMTPAVIASPLMPSALAVSAGIITARVSESLPHPVSKPAAVSTEVNAEIEPKTASAKPDADPPVPIRQNARVAPPHPPARKPPHTLIAKPTPDKPASAKLAVNATAARGEADSTLPAVAPAQDRAPSSQGVPSFVEARHEGDGLRNPPPRYPFAARRQGWEGRVLVSAAVTADGAVAGVELRASSGHTVLDEAALEAVRGWRFIPARQGARAVATRVDVPISFRLREAQ